MSVQILIGGDMTPTKSNIDAFVRNAPSLFSDGLRDAWRSADARVCNLETPLSDRTDPIEKCGPHLLAPAACADGLAALELTAAGLANNHIMDHGADALHNTLSLLATRHIASFGAGNSQSAADQAYFFEKDGFRIGFYAVCEREFSQADASRPGANPFDPMETPDRVRALSAQCDHLIVLFHGGREQYPFPSPWLQKACRKLIRCGARLVLCQHSHCVGCMEAYEGGTIVYGQGNFLFDASDAEPCFFTGLLANVSVSEKGLSVTFLPIRQVNGGVSLASGDDASEILNGFYARTEQLKETGFVERMYGAYAASMRERMLKVFLGGNPLLRAINLLYYRMPSRVYGEQQLKNIENTIACESLRELLLKGLSN